MVTPSAGLAPSYSSSGLAPAEVAADDRELFDLLRQAIEPTFVLVRKLGGGGMGVVYLARDPALKRLVAVKVMSPRLAADPEARARFQREAEAVAKISHPNVVAIHVVGELANGVPYLVMQYVDGRSMADRLNDEGPLEIAEAQAILGQVASALAAAHAKGIIHRDIKAANVLWDDAGARALVADFGIAAIQQPDADGDAMHLTQTGVVVGTPRYMSPEQLLAERVNEKTDIYSLGLLGYELLAHEGPFPVTSPNQQIVAHLRDAPRPISTLRADVDPALEALLAACLEKDPHARPDADDVARRLRHSTSVVLEWPPPGLEDLHGALERPLGKFVRGAFLIGVPLTVIATVPIESGFRPSYPTILVFPLFVALGVVGVLSAAADAYRLFRVTLRAAKAGYGWGIMAEVLVDRDRDGGALITGDREFAVLTVAQRNAIRRWRVLAAGLTGAAGLWALSGFFMTLPIAARLGGRGMLLTLSTLGIPIALLGAAHVVARREQRLLEPIKSRLRKHRSPIDRLSQLAQAWREAFDRAIAEVGRGHGAIGRITRRVVAITAASLAGAAGIITAAGLMAVAVGNEVTQISAVSLSSVREKIGRISRLRSLRLPVDPSITPREAGHALYSIASAGATGLEGAEVAPRKPLASLNLPASDPFRGSFLNGNAMRKARVGFTRQERDYLERVAALPGREEVATLGRASIADFYDVALKDPPLVAGAFGLPLPRYSRVKAAAHANVARAALAFAAGRATEAERLLREDIGMGFVLIEGPTAIENLIGAVIVGVGRAELVTLYELTGRQAEARAISAASDPVRDPVVEASTAKLRPEEREAFVSRVIRDETAPRGVRWEFTAVFLAYQPCADLGQVLFGPSETHRTQLADARRLLVRTPGEEKIMQLADRALETPPRFQEYGMPVFVGLNALMRFARTVDAMTGSHRMESCMTMQPY